MVFLELLCQLMRFQDNLGGTFAGAKQVYSALCTTAVQSRSRNDRLRHRNYQNRLKVGRFSKIDILE